jgi:hypothetical protein
MPFVDDKPMAPAALRCSRSVRRSHYNSFRSIRLGLSWFGWFVHYFGDVIYN